MPTEELFGAYNFLLEVGGVTAGYFKTVDGLSAESKVIDRSEVRLHDGIAQTDDLWKWQRSLATRSAVPMTVVVKKLGRGTLVEAQWVLRDALIAQFQAPEFGRSNTVTPVARVVLDAKPSVTLSGVGRRFAGSYYVNSTTHRF